MRILTKEEFIQKYPDNENFLKYSNGNGSSTYLESKNSLIRASALSQYDLWKGIELGKESLSKFKKIIKECNGSLINIDEIDKQLGINENVKEIQEELADEAVRKIIPAS